MNEMFFDEIDFDEIDFTNSTETMKEAFLSALEDIETQLERLAN